MIRETDDHIARLKFAAIGYLQQLYLMLDDCNSSDYRAVNSFRVETLKLVTQAFYDGFIDLVPEIKKVPVVKLCRRRRAKD